jgi:hypothetical protein
MAWIGGWAVAVAVLASGAHGPERTPPGWDAGGLDPDTLGLDRLDRATPGDTLPPGWELRTVDEARTPDVRIVEAAEGGPALELIADSAAGQAWLELEEELDPGTGTLAWMWRVEARPSEVDLRDPAADDAPARLFVAFGDGGLFGPPRFLFYTWGQDEEVGEAFRSHVSDDVGVVVVRNAADSTGAWLREERDLDRDYRRVFGDGENPEPITGFGLMTDTDQTGDSARVWLRGVRWVEGGG